MTDFSVLDLVPVRAGGTLGEAFDAVTMLAQTAEKAGCKRFWVAEHHAMAGIAGGATAVVLAHIGNATSTIRIGSGGIMLPNHTPFQIAEQFGTLDALFPGRIDLGLGRAPGAGPELQRALRKDLHRAAEMFPQDVVELMALMAGETAIHPTPGLGARPEFWMLGSSLFGAQLAAQLGFSEGVEILAGRGAAVDVPNSTGETPLIAAVHRRDSGLVRLLIEKGADPDRADNSGRTARDYARWMGARSTMLEEIERAEADRGEQAEAYGPS